MYKFNNTEDLSNALDNWGKYDKQELITMLCYYRDRYTLENYQSTWLDTLANHLRDTSDKEEQEASDEAYERYNSYSRKFNKKWF